MTRLGRIAAAATVALALIAAPARADDGFGLKDLDITFLNSDDTEARQAGSHPYAMRTTFDVNTTTDSQLGEIPIDAVRDLVTELPPGLVGDRDAAPRCSGADFVDIFDGLPACSNSSAVGLVELRVGVSRPESYDAPVYNLAAPPGVAAKLGFIALGNVPVTLEIGVNPDPPYNLVVAATKIAQPVRFYGAALTIWGNPAHPSHDAERGSCLRTGPCPAGIPERPFLTLPRSCPGGSLLTGIEADSWQNPGLWLRYEVLTPGTVDCPKLGFAPTIGAQPTSDHAESPSGLDFSLDIEDAGLRNPAGIAQSDIRKVVVALPQGVTANPSVAEGLAACSEADLARERVDSEPGEGCPQASNIGTVEVETPLLEGELLKGQVFVATQDQNPFRSLIALYIVIRDRELGILVKVPGKVEPDPRTGQLVSSFGEPPFELPQFPFSRFRFHFREGGRSPLITPAACGSYTTRALLTPWSDPGRTLPATASFEIRRGVGGGACPAGGPPPFEPGFLAGSLNNDARSFTPFYMRLTRRDGDQDMTRFSAVLPPGLLGKLAGVGKCPQAQIDGARSRAGRAELAVPSCPAGSQIGRIEAGAGVGSQLTYVPGRMYLAGPYKGAPLSVAVITPAVAGPFDAGTVVVQVGLGLDPVTGEVQADGSAADPIPHILKGIPLKLRDLRVHVDRDEFILNPTSCAPSEVRARLWGGGLDPFSVGDDFPVSLQSRFQAANCSRLDFKPRLSLRLTGGTKRGDHPALRAVLRPQRRGANLAKAVVRLPHSAFLEQGHIRTVCTRVQFAAERCPKGAIYGHVKAFTPLLEEPLKGPVYLRSSSNPLPDLVFDLEGIVDIEASARIDSVKGSIRATFSSVPDAPVSKVIVAMRGGQRGLIVNSQNLCAKPSRAIVHLEAHNGKHRNLRPVVRPHCGRRR